MSTTDTSNILIILQLQIFIKLINFKDNLRTIEAQFPKKLRTTEAHFEFTGPYKKKRVGITHDLTKNRIH